MWCMGLVAPWHVKSSRTRDGTWVPCIGRQILNPWTTREALNIFVYLCIWLCQVLVEVHGAFLFWLEGSVVVAHKLHCSEACGYIYIHTHPRGGHGNPLQYSGLENPHGQRRLMGYSPWGCTESDMTKHTIAYMHINICVCVCVLSRSVMSDSLRPHGL